MAAAAARLFAVLALLVAVSVLHGAGAEVQGGAAAAPGLRGLGQGGARGAPRGAPRGRGGGPGLRGAPGTASQKVSAGATPPLKAATSQKLEAELADKVSGLTLDAKVPAGMCPMSATGAIVDRLLACSSEDARAGVVKELVAKVSETGVGGLETLGVVSLLMEALKETGKAGQKRAGALAALDHLLTAFGTAAEPWTLGLLEGVLDAIGHKSAEVNVPAKAVATKMFELLSDQAVRLVLPTVSTAGLRVSLRSSVQPTCLILRSKQQHLMLCRVAPPSLGELAPRAALWCDI